MKKAIILIKNLPFNFCYNTFYDYDFVILLLEKYFIVIFTKYENSSDICIHIYLSVLVLFYPTLFILKQIEF